MLHQRDRSRFGCGLMGRVGVGLGELVYNINLYFILESTIGGVVSIQQNSAAQSLRGRNTNTELSREPTLSTTQTGS